MQVKSFDNWTTIADAANSALKKIFEAMEKAKKEQDNK